MHSRAVALAVASFILGTISIGVAYAWNGPTAAPPNGNVAAPINVGSTDQVKNGGLGVNSLAVFGNSLLGGSYGSNAYLNFGAASGSSGYGIRDNAGTLEFKNDGGSWGSLQTIICALTNCTATHASFSVNKGGVNQAVKPALWTMLTWPNEDFDTNNNFANSRFTPTVPGKYIFELTAECIFTTSTCQVGIYKNGVMVTTSWGEVVSGNSASGHASIILDMNGTTDFVEAYVYTGDYASISGDPIYTNFSGALLSG